MQDSIYTIQGTFWRATSDLLSVVHAFNIAIDGDMPILRYETTWWRIVAFSVFHQDEDDFTEDLSSGHRAVSGRY
jgi:hypothetical protein